MKVSVIVALYNKASYVERAIRSILDQTFTDFEIIVVNDGSADGSDKVVEAIEDPRIKLISQPNSGAATARNTGIKAANGDLIAFLDADDVWRPDNLAMHTALLQRHIDVVWSAGLYNRRLANGKLEKLTLPPHCKEMIQDEVLQDALFFLPPRFYLCTITVAIRKWVFNEIGLMNTELKTAEDLDMWVRIALKYPRIAYCSKAIAEYYMETPDSLTEFATRECGELSEVIFSRKYLKITKEMNTKRVMNIRAICKSILRGRIGKFMLDGDIFSTMKIVDEFQQLLGRKLTQKYKILSKLPTKLLIIMAMTKKKLHRIMQPIWQAIQ